MNKQKFKPSSEQRRLALAEQIQRERAVLILAGRDICESFTSLGAGVQAASGVGKLRLFGLGALVVFCVAKPKRALGVIKMGFSCWRFWQKCKSFGNLL